MLNTTQTYSVENGLAEERLKELLQDKNVGKIINELAKDIKTTDTSEDKSCICECGFILNVSETCCSVCNPNHCFWTYRCPICERLIDIYKYHCSNCNKGKKLPDPVLNPSHYTFGKYKCIDIIEDLELGSGFFLGSALKYIWRAGKKPGSPRLQDLQKARFYLDKEIKRIEKIENHNNEVNPIV